MTIDRRSDRAVHRQLADLLRDRVIAGEFPPGAALPSEPKLVDQYGISRTAVRQGLAILKAEGVILSEQGRGWFVREHRIVRRMASSRYQAELNQLARPTDQRDQAPFTYDHHDFRFFELGRHFTTVPADEDLAEVFGVEVRTPLLRRTFVFYFDSEPHRRSYSYLLAEMVRDTPVENPDNEPWPGGTMAQLDFVGVRVTAVEETISARMPTLDEADELHIDEGVPVIAVRRRMLSGERVVEACVDIVIPADRVELHYRMDLTDPGPARPSPEDAG